MKCHNCGAIVQHDFAVTLALQIFATDEFSKWNTTWKAPLAQLGAYIPNHIIPNAFLDFKERLLHLNPSNNGPKLNLCGLWQLLNVMDSLSIGLLKDNVYICGPILTEMVNSCLKWEIFPSELKLADITLILDPHSQRAGSYKFGAVIVNV